MLGLTEEDIAARIYNHNAYNQAIYALDRDFSENDLIKVLVIGNSHGRDVSNILLESAIASKIELSYFDRKNLKRRSIEKRWTDADLVILARKVPISKDKLIARIAGLGAFNSIDLSKVICFGTKDYGYSTGIHYNKSRYLKNFSKYYANMKDGVINVENSLQQEWGDTYVGSP